MEKVKVELEFIKDGKPVCALYGQACSYLIFSQHDPDQNKDKAMVQFYEYFKKKLSVCISSDKIDEIETIIISIHERALKNNITSIEGLMEESVFELDEHEDFDLEKEQLQWYGVNAAYGEDLGYPKCCVQMFCDQPPKLLRTRKPEKIDIDRYNAGCIDEVFTGFIPCADHAIKILKGEITLNSLIKNRNPLFPEFPNTPY